ncbi:MAG: hypothetical protein HZC16_00735 [Candidatus Omnitrophica bacterium]|nr:hypothetical protein [Candidatus Omnitrophota bacterium]
MPVRKSAVKIRKVWLINPKARLKQSKKIYSRVKLKQETRRAARDESR